jgi:hypothetical protein
MKSPFNIQKVAIIRIFFGGAWFDSFHSRKYPEYRSIALHLYYPEFLRVHKKGNTEMQTVNVTGRNRGIALHYVEQFCLLVYFMFGAIDQS